MTDAAFTVEPDPRRSLGARSVLPRPTRLTLQAEAAAALVGVLVAYGAVGGSWWIFAGLILVPDLAMLGYLAGPRAGAIAYNAVHTTLGPIALGLAAWAGGSAALAALALIWLAHIAADRAMGYGLKADGFKVTHLS